MWPHRACPCAGGGILHGDAVEGNRQGTQRSWPGPAAGHGGLRVRGCWGSRGLSSALGHTVPSGRPLPVAEPLTRAVRKLEGLVLRLQRTPSPSLSGRRHRKRCACQSTQGSLPSVWEAVTFPSPTLTLDLRRRHVDDAEGSVWCPSSAFHLLSPHVPGSTRVASPCSQVRKTPWSAAGKGANKNTQETTTASTPKQGECRLRSDVSVTSVES